MQTICEDLQLSVRQCNQDCILVSFTPVNMIDTSTVDLNRLEASFMYTQLFKNTLLDMKNRETSVQDLVKYWQCIYADNPTQMRVIEQFDREYCPEKAIWWYTGHGFIYEMLNRSLCLLEADILVTMGFFFNDLHR